MKLCERHPSYEVTTKCGRCGRPICSVCAAESSKFKSPHCAECANLPEHVRRLPPEFRYDESRPEKQETSWKPAVLAGLVVLFLIASAISYVTTRNTPPKIEQPMTEDLQHYGQWAAAQTVGSALVEYEQRVGVYPTTLEELVPRYLDAAVLKAVKDNGLLYRTDPQAGFRLTFAAKMGGLEKWAITARGAEEAVPRRSI